MTTSTDAIVLPQVVSRDEWLVQRKELLALEKEATRARDALNARRRELPMVEIGKEYVLEGPDGRRTLLELFEGRTQLIVYHFMLDPEHEEGCPGCSHFADNVGELAHLHARDTTLTLVSRAPLSRIQPFKARMGWKMPWVSSFGSDFNYDFHVTMDESVAPVEYNYRGKAEMEAIGQGGDEYRGELPGLSVFLRDGDRVFHTYSTYGRGLDPLLNSHNFLDLTPFGRGEEWGGMPDLGGQGMNWLRHHDRYENAPAPSACCGS